MLYTLNSVRAPDCHIGMWSLILSNAIKTASEDSSVQFFSCVLQLNHFVVLLHKAEQHQLQLVEVEILRAHASDEAAQLVKAFVFLVI